MMRPKDLGFAKPCQRCMRNLIKTILPTEELLKVHGHLEWLKDQYPVSGQFCTHTFACRRCGCRWVLWDLQDPPFFELNQESADGLYYETEVYYVVGKGYEFGRYVDGKKHGRFTYYRYRHRYRQHWYGDTPILSDLWDHGRLVEWQEYGPSVVNAKGEWLTPVVRSWHAKSLNRLRRTTP